MNEVCTLFSLICSIFRLIVSFACLLRCFHFFIATPFPYFFIFFSFSFLLLFFFFFPFFFIFSHCSFVFFPQTIRQRVADARGGCVGPDGDGTEPRGRRTFPRRKSRFNMRGLLLVCPFQTTNRRAPAIQIQTVQLISSGWIKHGFNSRQMRLQQLTFFFLSGVSHFHP